MRSATRICSALHLSCLFLMVAVFAFPSVVQAAPRISAGLPPNTSWTYIDNKIQAWMGPLESDDVSGLHYNLHIQPRGGGSDYADYHITYRGVTQDASGDDVYTWNAYESINGTNTLYTTSTALDESSASETILYEIADNIGASVGDSELTNALIADSIASSVEVDGLVDVLFALMLLA